MSEFIATSRVHAGGECDDGACNICGLDYDFEMPEGLASSALRRDVVIFAGAGISTEVSTVFPSTVLEVAAARLGMSRDSIESFPQTLEDFQNRFGRTELVRMIKRKFDFVDSFRDPRFHSRRFHHELSTMPYLRDIVTTNWDTYFEDGQTGTPTSRMSVRPPHSYRVKTSRSGTCRVAGF